MRLSVLISYDIDSMLQDSRLYISKWYIYVGELICGILIVSDGLSRQNVLYEYI